MTIPKYNELYSNVLSLFSNETEEYKTKYVKQIVSDLLDLSPDERNQMLPSRNQPLIENRVGWTITFLKKAGLLESRRRGYVNITKLGLKEIKENPHITEEDLYKFPSFAEFRRNNNSDVNETKLKNVDYIEKFTSLVSDYNSEISNCILNNILECSIPVFDNLIQDLLLKLGYHNVKLNINSDNITGIIHQDKLGLDRIVIQAINKSDKIKVSELQQFAGLIVSKGLTKGIFITSSSFNKNAIEYVEDQSNLKIILINGKKLAQLMIENDVGTSVTHIYKIKEVNNDYFNIS